jgi:hypothetical protein
MVHIRRSALTISTVGLLCLFTALGGALSAANAASAAGSVKGDPQPAPKPFVIGASGYAGGSVAMEPNGTLVVVSGSTADGSGVSVCVVPRGASKCSSTATLTPPVGDSVTDVPQVVIPSANHVLVLMGGCCNPGGADLLFSSTNGGATFGAPVTVGDLGVDVSALISGHIVFTATDEGGGAEVESVPVNDPAGETTADTPTTEAFDVGVANYKGGALIGTDDAATDPTTHVSYSSAGANFTDGKYTNVGAFPGEQLIAMSGDALLTVKTGTGAVELRLFNGTGFGAAHAVPGFQGGGGTALTVDQDSSGMVHVFSERGLSQLVERSTANGASWTGAVNLGAGIGSQMLAAVLDSNGSGLVVGTGEEQAAWGYPVLAAQSVSFGLHPSTIKKGKTTIGSGFASPAAPGRVVELQIGKAGLWHTVATTREGSGGSFSFTIKGTAPGTFYYRAVALDQAGYALYGYSHTRNLKVTS